MTREEAAKVLESSTAYRTAKMRGFFGELTQAMNIAISALRHVPDTNVGKWIPCDSEVSGSLIHRIAEYFREWDGSTPAPIMQVHIDDLRTICQWNTERCALREELKKQNADWIPCSERLPDDDGFYLATILNGLGYTTTQKLLFNGKGWCTAMPWEILAWMPVPEPYKGE